MYGSGRRLKRDHYSLDPSSPFRPITIQEGKRYPQQQIGSPVKPIPIKEAKGSRDEAAPKGSHWTDDDDGGFGTPGRAKRSLFTPRQEKENIEDSGRGRRRMREQRNRGELQPKPKSLNVRQATGSMSSGRRQRPRSLDRSTAVRDAPNEYRHAGVPDLSLRIGQSKGRTGAFKAVNPQPRSPDRSFYGHQPHTYWTPYERRQLRRERPKTIAVPRAIDFTQHYLPKLADTKRAKTTGDLSRISAFDPLHGSLLKGIPSIGPLDSTAQSRRKKEATYSPAILRRKPNNNIRRDRPKSMPNAMLDSSIFGRIDENDKLKRSKNYYDFEDAPLIRPDKAFDLFPKAQNKGAQIRNQMSPRPNKKKITGGGL